MSALTLWAVLLLLVSPATEQQELVVRCVCGTVVHERKITRKNGSSHYTHKPMKEASVVLFRRQGGSCCEGRSPISSVQVGRSGHFKFSEIKPGLYWIAVRAGGSTAARAIRYEPVKGYSPSFSVYTFAVTDTGELNIGVTVTVD
jgi:hypothetical protein